MNHTTLLFLGANADAKFINPNKFVVEMDNTKAECVRFYVATPAEAKALVKKMIAQDFIHISTKPFSR